MRCLSLLVLLIAPIFLFGCAKTTDTSLRTPGWPAIVLNDTYTYVVTFEDTDHPYQPGSMNANPQIHTESSYFVSLDEKRYAQHLIIITHESLRHDRYRFPPTDDDFSFRGESYSLDEYSVESSSDSKLGRVLTEQDSSLLPIYNCIELIRNVRDSRRMIITHCEPLAENAKNNLEAEILQIGF